MKVDISDILDCLDRDDKLALLNQSLIAIKIGTETEYSCEHLELHFSSGDILKVSVSTMPSADTSFVFKVKYD